jgi:hypothetical protein
VTVDIRAASPGSGEWKTPDEIISRAHSLGVPTPSVTDVTLTGTSSVKRIDWVARVLEYDDLWDETYGLTVDNRRFMIRVFYTNEASKIDSFRSTVVEILSSISVAN